MKIIHLNHSDSKGGAARAAFRIHKSLSLVDVESFMGVNVAFTGDLSVSGPISKFDRFVSLARPHLLSPLKKLQQTNNSSLHSFGVLPSSWPKYLNKLDVDLVHLHWVQAEMLSIKDIAKIKKPIVWTLHDMWPICGAEHYSTDYRWKVGYSKHNRPSRDKGLDINRWVWNLKRKHWKHPFNIVCPSHWLAQCVRTSAIMKNWPVSVIPNPINSTFWRPMDQKIARQIFDLPLDTPILLFGAIRGHDPRKGIDLLLSAISLLRETSDHEEFNLVVFGQPPVEPPQDLGFSIYYTGQVADDITLRILYNTADAMIVPSRLDNLPNTALEAQACGTPVISFDIGGMPDIIDHGVNGYLARPFNTSDLAFGIRKVLSERHNQSYRYNSLKSVKDKYSYSSVALKYLEVYSSACS